MLTVNSIIQLKKSNKKKFAHNDANSLEIVTFINNNYPTIALYMRLDAFTIKSFPCGAL